MMEQVSAAVEHIHKANILHRDLKPSNIMIESSGHSWVIDIGLGRERCITPRDGDKTPPDRGENGFARQGASVPRLKHGSRDDRDPRRERGARASLPRFPMKWSTPFRRRPIWSLGVTLYQLLTASSHRSPASETRRSAFEDADPSKTARPTIPA